MAVEWTITGQTGKTVGTGDYTLEQLQAEGAVVSFNSLASDTMSWRIDLAKRSDAATVVPDLGQAITLKRNGVRYFSGIVTGREPNFTASSFGYSITVEGGWWWLSKLYLSSDRQDQSGTSSERTAFVFPLGSPRNHLLALIARAIAQGAPISEGNIASVFNIPRLSLSNIPFAEAIAEVMRWVADGTVYFDYSGAGHPKLSMQRRTPAATVTITPATTIAPEIRIKPRLDLKVSEVKVFFARRQTSGAKRITRYDAYTAGAPSADLPQRQPVLVSGPEKVFDQLPQDFTDSVQVRSAALDVGKIIERYDERIRSTGATGFSVGGYSEEVYPSGEFVMPSIATQITDADGNAIPAAFNKYLTLGEPRDWWTKDGIEHIQARVAATISRRVQSPTPIPPGYEPAVPEWFQVLGGQVYNYTVSVPGGGLRAVHIFSTTTSVSVPLVKTLWSVPTTLIRAEDYGFVNPPSDLAANLLATQNWLPYEGNVSYVVEDIEAGHHVGKKLNIAGFLPER